MDAGGERFDSSPRPHHVEAVREARIDEWKQSRTLRLEMLADTPHAFGDRLADVLHWDDEQWRIRHYSHLLPDSAVFVAVERDGRWVGQMEAREFHDHTPARVWLMGVYVTPAHRGNGTATALLEAVEQWVRGRGFGQLYLDVHEHSSAARRFYQRKGFVPTGSTAPYPLDPSTAESEMVKALEP